MTPYESAGTPRPWGWRQALAPAAGLWLLTAAGAAELGHASWLRPGPIWTRLGDLPEPGRTALAATAVMLLWAAAGLAATATGRLVEWLWLRPGWGRLGEPVLRRRRARWDDACDEVDTALAAAQAPGAGPAERIALQRAAARRNGIALAPPRCPGWMADRMAALELRVANEYGLDLATAWPRLWLLLPPPARDDIRRARAGWDDSMLWGAWALWFGVLGLLWWPVLVPAAAVLVWSRRRARAALDTLAHLAESTIDVHGIELARKLGLATDQDRLEPHIGRMITIVTRKGV